MRVALFTDTFDETNGVARTYHYLVDYAAATGLPLHVYTYGPVTCQESLGSVTIFRKRRRVPVHYYCDLSYDIAPNPDVRREFCRHQYDIVHLATPASLGLCGLRLAQRARLPAVGVFHTAVPDYLSLRVRVWKRRFGRVAWRAMQWFYDQMDTVLVPSQCVARKLRSMFSTPVEVWNHGVDAQAFYPDPPRDDGMVRLVFVGRLAVEKNLGLLLEVFAEIQSIRQNVCLDIVGDGPMFPAVHRLCGPNVRALGWLRGEELRRAYSQADIFAFPSVTETFGNVVLEAMACGLPVVVMNGGGAKEIPRHGVDGFIARDKASFKADLLALIDDVSLREQMGAAARQAALDRTWEREFDRLLVLYAKCAAAPSRHTKSAPPGWPRLPLLPRGLSHWHDILPRGFGA